MAQFSRNPGERCDLVFRKESARYIVSRKFRSDLFEINTNLAHISERVESKITRMREVKMQRLSARERCREFWLAVSGVSKLDVGGSGLQIPRKQGSEA